MLHRFVFHFFNVILHLVKFYVIEMNSKPLRFSLVAIAALTLSLQSCFKDEPLNAECDIEQATITVSEPEEVFFHTSDATIDVPSESSTINFKVRYLADITSLAPQFKLTAGATITPESGSTHDFSQGPVEYTVTSEDGEWHRTYKVSVTPVLPTSSPRFDFDFEDYEIYIDGYGKENYYIWHNKAENTPLDDDWATSNPGALFTIGTGKPMTFPTIPLATGYEGAGVELITRDTGAFGAMANMRIAPGSMFLGTFNMLTALTNPLGATIFGVAFDKKPIALTGYYQYTPGAKYQDVNGNAVSGKTDHGAIYAVFFDNENSTFNLHGDDVKSSPKILALADLGQLEATDGWQYFEIPFEYNKDIDETKLGKRGYSVTVVFSSSSKGDIFEGAIGSSLKVDKVSLICEEDE